MPARYSQPAPAPELAVTLPPTNEQRRQAREEEYRRHHQFLKDDAAHAPTFLNRLKVSLHSRGHRLDNIFSKFAAAIVEETHADQAEKSAERFFALGLSPEEATAVGPLLTDFHVCTVAAEAGQSVASGWLFVTQHALVFDGVVDFPVAPPPDPQPKIRFHVAMSKIVSFHGLAWEKQKGTPMPAFVQLQQPAAAAEAQTAKQQQRKKDAVLVYDSEKNLHAFWAFSRYGIDWVDDFLVALANVWQQHNNPTATPC